MSGTLVQCCPVLTAVQGFVGHHTCIHSQYESLHKACVVLLILKHSAIRQSAALCSFTETQRSIAHKQERIKQN